MSRETYIRGFRKVAEAHGIDPVALAKYAASSTIQVAPESETAPSPPKPKADLLPITQSDSNVMHSDSVNFSGDESPHRVPIAKKISGGDSVSEQQLFRGSFKRRAQDAIADLLRKRRKGE